LERLDKILSAQLGESRTEVKEYLKQGRVKVNGNVQKRYEFKVNPSCDQIELDGRILVYRKYIYIMMNKPSGVLCSTRDGQTDTVIDLVPGELYRKNLSPAGRLDKDTEGFVFLTDDGEMCHKIISPKKDIIKTYIARINSSFLPKQKELLESATIILDGKPVKKASFAASENDSCEVIVKISEGRFHQIKRMFLAAGLEVTYLKRISIGGLELDESLGLGKCREVSALELMRIMQ